jgi:hypothetical protein
VVKGVSRRPGQATDPAQAALAGGAVSRLTAEKARPMPSMVPIAQVPLRGHSTINNPPSRAEPPGRTTAGRRRRQLHHPLDRQQEAQEQGQAEGALQRERQQADAPQQVKRPRQAPEQLRLAPLGTAEPQQLGDAGGDRHTTQGDGEQGGRHEGQGNRQGRGHQQQQGGDAPQGRGGRGGHGSDCQLELIHTLSRSAPAGVESSTPL